MTIYCNKSYVNVVSLKISSFTNSMPLTFIIHCGYNFCILRCYSKTNTNFFFFLTISWTEDSFFCVWVFLTSLLTYNCFTLLCQFLLYNKVNQLYVYIYPHVPSLLCLPPTLPRFVFNCSSQLSQHTISSFLIKSRTFNFSLKGNTLWLLFGMSELPVSLRLHFVAIIQ